MKVRIIASNPASGQDPITHLIGKVFEAANHNEETGEVSIHLTDDSEFETGHILLQNSEYEEAERMVPCGICGKLTTMTGTKRCNRCWELERRLQADQAIAIKLLVNLTRTVQVYQTLDIKRLTESLEQAVDYVETSLALRGKSLNADELNAAVAEIRKTTSSVSMGRWGGDLREFNLDQARGLIARFKREKLQLEQSVGEGAISDKRRKKRLGHKRRKKRLGRRKVKAE
jgi:hypothetical protein